MTYKNYKKSSKNYWKLKEKKRAPGSEQTRALINEAHNK